MYASSSQISQILQALGDPENYPSAIQELSKVLLENDRVAISSYECNMILAQLTELLPFDQSVESIRLSGFVARALGNLQAKNLKEFPEQLMMAGSDRPLRIINSLITLLYMHREYPQPASYAAYPLFKTLLLREDYILMINHAFPKIIESLLYILNFLMTQGETLSKTQAFDVKEITVFLEGLDIFIKFQKIRLSAEHINSLKKNLFKWKQFRFENEEKKYAFVLLLSFLLTSLSRYDKHISDDPGVKDLLGFIRRKSHQESVA
jgi:hypothetical protein